MKSPQAHPQDAWKPTFTRQVFTLTIGSLLAQLAAYLASPLITRLYSAEQMGQTSVLISLGLILAQVANLKYDLAISTARSEVEAIQTFLVAILAAAGVSATCGALILAFGPSLAKALGVLSLEGWLFILPINLFLVGIFQALQMWHSRKAQFKLISLGQGAQAIGTSAGRIGFGFVNGGSVGLLLGTTIGLLCSCAVLCRDFIRGAAAHLSGTLWSPSTLRGIASRHSQLPIFFSLASVLNSLASSVPVFMINKLHSSEEAGQFNLTVLALGLPSSVVAGAIGQVFLQHANERWRDREPISGFTIKMAIKLTCLAVPASLLVIAFAPIAFPFIFGSQWKAAGDYARICVFAFAVQFVVSPVTMAFVATESILTGSAWKILYFCTTLTTAVLCRSLPARTYLEIYACHDIVLYGLQLALVIWVSRKNKIVGSGPAP